MTAANNTKAIMALLFVGVLMGALDLAIIGPALPAIQKEFGLDNRDLSWLFNVYVLAQLIGTPLLAKLSDRYGRRIIYLLCVSGFGIGSLMLVLAGDQDTLLLGRAVQGFGASGIFPVAAAVIGDTFPKEKQGGALGLIGAVFGLAFLIGPVIGGILLQWSWQLLFVINLPIALALIIAGWRLLPSKSNATPAPFDWLGGVLLTTLLLGLAIGITNLDTADIARSLKSIDVWPALLIGLVLLPFFWKVEKSAADPIIRPSFFSAKQIRLVMIIAAGLGTIECAQVFLPALAVVSLGVTESTAAWLMLPGVFVMMVISPLAGKAVDKVGPGVIIQVAAVFILVGILMYGLVEMSFVTFISAGLIAGVGIASLLGAPLRYIIIEESRPDDRASAQGLLNIFLAIGQLSGAAVVGAVATSKGGGTEGYQTAYLVLGILAVVMFFITLGLKRKRLGQVKTANS
ncbi:MAG: MFS transporter [Gammaproteobacteria bacterium]|jgi:multidrug resistance protein|nr:MFS transporter [Gammaproteobacteria bacterium]